MDTVSRLGGDEFVVLQLGIGGPAEANALGRRITETLAEPFIIQGHQIVIGASVGIALAPNDGNDPDELLRNADIALYRAKTDGRGICRFFEPGMDAHLQERRRLELDLRKALDGKQFFLLYQPQINAETGDINGFEALLRWRHPDRGVISPADFIPVAEETGLIVPLGEWVIREACREAMTWPGELRVAVNLSAAQFKNPMLLHSIVSALNVSKLVPSRLELEITETVLLSNDVQTKLVLEQLKALGVRIAMDDFGTGYSSLSFLRSFPFDKIKIDRSFIRELGHSEDSLAIIKAVAGLGTSLRMTTTAEGVETEVQLSHVREQGYKEVQGFYFSRPIAADEIHKLIRKNLKIVA
jgi:predicted signal transduction protein with EAL and GGDEF domain